MFRPPVYANRIIKRQFVTALNPPLPLNCKEQQGIIDPLINSHNTINILQQSLENMYIADSTVDGFQDILNRSKPNRTDISLQLIVWIDSEYENTGLKRTFLSLSWSVYRFRAANFCN